MISEAHASFFGSRGQRYHDLSGGNVGARPTRAGQRGCRMVSHGFTPHAEEFGLDLGGINHGQVMVAGFCSGGGLYVRRGSNLS